MKPNQKNLLVRDAKKIAKYLEFKDKINQQSYLQILRKITNTETHSDEIITSSSSDKDTWGVKRRKAVGQIK